MCRRRSVYDPHVSFLRTFLVFFCAARHPADSDGRPTAGAQVLARVPMVPSHPYHSGPALPAECRLALRDVYSPKATGTLLWLLAATRVTCFPWSCCLVLSCLARVEPPWQQVSKETLVTLKWLRRKHKKRFSGPFFCGMRLCGRACGQFVVHLSHAVLWI